MANIGCSFLYLGTLAEVFINEYVSFIYEHELSYKRIRNAFRLLRKLQRVTILSAFCTGTLLKGLKGSDSCLLDWMELLCSLFK